MRILHLLITHYSGPALSRNPLAGRFEREMPRRVNGRTRLVNLLGKAGHVRSVPIPVWVKAAVDAWTSAAAITNGPVFRAINKAGRTWGDGMSLMALWDVVRATAARAGIDTCCVMKSVRSLNVKG